MQSTYDTESCMDSMASAPDFRKYEHANNALVAERFKSSKYWHWSNIPTEVLLDWGHLTTEDIRNNRRRRLKDGSYEEYGFDGLVQLADNTFLGVQSKLYSPGGYIHGLGNYAKALLATRRGNPNNGGVLCITPDARLSGHEVAAFDNPDLNMHVWRVPFQAPQEEAPVAGEPDLELRPVQKDAQAFLANHQHALLSQACATGKTLVAGHHIARSRFNVVVVASPLRASAEQNLVRLSAFMPGCTSIRFWSGSGGQTTNPLQLQATPNDKWAYPDRHNLPTWCVEFWKASMMF
jgi:hypothetical protein